MMPQSQFFSCNLNQIELFAQMSNSSNGRYLANLDLVLPFGLSPHFHSTWSIFRKITCLTQKYKVWRRFRLCLDHLKKLA